MIQCRNRQKQSKDSQTAKNDHWCTNRHTSTQSPPNTQSRANAATSRDFITCAWAVATARRPWAGLTLCVYMDVHASAGSRSLPRAATLVVQCGLCTTQPIISQNDPFISVQFVWLPLLVLGLSCRSLLLVARGSQFSVVSWSRR